MGAARLTERDLELLRSSPSTGSCCAAHVAALLGSHAAAASARLGKLASARLPEASRRGVQGRPRCYQITRTGLARDRQRPPLARDRPARATQHDVGVAWLWLAARARHVRPAGARSSPSAGCARTTAAREPDAEPLGGRGWAASARAAGESFTIRTWCCGPPTAGGSALELELTAKSRTRLETILAGYAADPRIDGVVYLVESRPSARARRSARRAGSGSRTSSTCSGCADRSAAASRPRRPRSARRRRAGARTGARERGRMSAGPGPPRPRSPY